MIPSLDCHERAAVIMDMGVLQTPEPRRAVPGLCASSDARFPRSLLVPSIMVRP